MRSPVTFLVVCLFLACASLSAPADVIYLKNGRKIWADHVRENVNKIEYDVGDDSYAIPKASVDRVEAGGIAPAYASGNSGGGTKDLPAFTPDDTLAGHEDLASKVVHDGKVDADALDAWCRNSPLAA